MQSVNSSTDNGDQFQTLLHDLKNHLGSLKLYVAFIKRSLEKNTLDHKEALDICDKMLSEIDALAERTKNHSQLSKR